MPRCELQVPTRPSLAVPFLKVSDEAPRKASLGSRKLVSGEEPLQE